MKRSPVAGEATGLDVMFALGQSDENQKTVISTPTSIPQGFEPIERVWPGPGTVRPVKPVTGPDEIVSRSDIVGCIRNNRRPTTIARPRLERPHQAELQGLAPMLTQHADAAEIAGVRDMRRRRKPGECNGQAVAKCEPPMPEFEFRNWRALEECQAMEVAKRIRDIFIECIYLPYPVHCLPRAFTCRE